MRYSRPDANQKQITRLLDRVGATWSDLHNTGGGVPDLFVTYNGFSFFVEAKRKNGKLRDTQIAFATKHSGWVLVVRGWKDMLSIIRLLREWQRSHGAPLARFLQQFEEYHE